MNIYRCEEYYFDSVWANSREILLHSFSLEFEITIIDFSKCNWIDLQPLVDIFLQVAHRCLSNKNVVLKLTDGPSKKFSRVIKFLLDSGFFEGLNDDSLTNPEKILININGVEHCLIDFLSIKDRLSFQSRTLDFESIVPCLLIDAKDFSNRSDVFKFCHQLREVYLSKGEFVEIGIGRAKILKLQPSLVSELKIFFNSILTELIDNVRLHKSSDNPLCALYIRIRKREERLIGPRRIAEPSWEKLTKFKQLTSFSWEHDIIECVFSDIGDSIQETFLKSWYKRYSGTRKKVPRLPNNRRIDGKNADELILKAIFEENISSLPEEERERQGIPLNVTGLCSIRQTLLDSNRYFSVNSGRNYLSIGSFGKGSEKDYSPQVKAGGRVKKTDGVHYFFRIAPSPTRRLSKWADCIQGKNVLGDSRWWCIDHNKDNSTVYFISKFEIPEKTPIGSYLICRANHTPPKTDLYIFLISAFRKNLKIIFAELSQPIALYLYIQIDLILKRENVNILCPIITNTFRVIIPGKGNNKYLDTFNSEKAIKHNRKNVWWDNPYSPINSIRDVFVLCRNYDSKLFWEELQNNKTIFNPEPIKWNQDVALICGFLSLQIALQKQSIRKIVARRLLCTSHLLNSNCIKPVSDSMRFITNEVYEKFLPYEQGNGPTVYFGDILATKTDIIDTIHFDKGNEPILLPVLIYPEDGIYFIKNKEKYKCNRTFNSALEWLSDYKFNVDDVYNNLENAVSFTRLGRSEKIRKKPHDNLQILAKQLPEKSYRVWQSHKLINIGHYSYNQHHYFIWLDLIGFVGSRTIDSNNMLNKMVDYICARKTKCILYSNNDDSESLIKMLKQNAVLRSQNNFPLDDKILPITPGITSCYIGARELSTVLEEIDVNKNFPIIFIDDALVSGRTNREIRLCLHDCGYKNVHSMVMLDRSNPRIELLKSKNDDLTHFSWWSIAVPSTGNDQTCTICNGIEKIQLVSTGTNSEAVRRILNSYIKLWNKKDNLQRFENKLEKKWLNENIHKKLGNYKEKNIDLKTSEALCLWALDMMNRLEYYDYLFLKDHSDIRGFYSEILSGIIFLFWNKLDICTKKKVYINILECMWVEDRESARSLIAVAIASLKISEIKEISDLAYKISIEKGIPNIDTGILLYLISNLSILNENLTPNLLKKINSYLRQIKDPIIKRKFVKSYNISLSISECDLTDNLAKIAINRIGYPGRDFKHYYVFRLLNELKTFSGNETEVIEKAREVSILLEPVRNLIENRKEIFRSYGVYENLHQIFNDLDLICFEKPRASDIKKFFDNSLIENTFRKLYDYLGNGIHGRFHVRRIIGIEYIHYIPFLIREQINLYVSKKCLRENIKCSIDDFFVDFEIDPKERQLLDKSIREEPIHLLLEDLQRKDSVFFDKATIIDILYSIVSDIKHPISNKIKLESGCFIHISFYLENSMYCIKFVNIATPNDYNDADGRSWQFIKSEMKRYEGDVKIEYDKATNKLKRILKFKYIKGNAK